MQYVKKAANQNIFVTIAREQDTQRIDDLRNKETMKQIILIQVQYTQIKQLQQQM
jgi:hypothetical protein